MRRRPLFAAARAGAFSPPSDPAPAFVRRRALPRGRMVHHRRGGSPGIAGAATAPHPAPAPPRQAAACDARLRLAPPLPLPRRARGAGVRFPLDAALHVVHDMIELTEKSLVRLFQTSPVWKKLIALRHEAVLELLKAVAHGARPRARGEGEMCGQAGGALDGRSPGSRGALGGAVRRSAPRAVPRGCAAASRPGERCAVRRAHRRPGAPPRGSAAAGLASRA